MGHAESALDTIGCITLDVKPTGSPVPEIGAPGLTRRGLER